MILNGLKNECKLFADDTSLYSVVNDINNSTSDLNEDLEKIGNWAFKWKINFNLDPNKKAQEIILSRKKTASLHQVVYFDNKPVKSLQIHKHLGMIIDSNLSYKHHINSILNKVNKTTGLLRKFQLMLPRHSLITIYKTFISTSDQISTHEKINFLPISSIYLVFSSLEMQRRFIQTKEYYNKPFTV